MKYRKLIEECDNMRARLRRVSRYVTTLSKQIIPLIIKVHKNPSNNTCGKLVNKYVIITMQQPDRSFKKYF